MIRRTAAALLVTVAFVLSLPRPARAITIGFAPVSSTHGVGDVVDVDVVISGLDSQSQVVSAFDIDVLFDDTVLQATGVTFGPYLGDPDAVLPEAIAHFDLLSPVARASEVSLLTDLELFDIQADTITLFSIRFLALAPGRSALSFARGSDDVKGSLASPPDQGPSVLPLDTLDGTVVVVPEPGTALLIVLSGLGLVVRRRAWKRVR
jgi:hypothetical protein